MSEHNNTAVERHCDVAVVGGSAAGLAAALQLGRQRRSVIVIDAGEPRNATAAHMHSYLGREGTAPSELTTVGREEVRSYGGEILRGRVERVTRTDADHFRLEIGGGHGVVARRVLAATGLVDELPDIEGLADRWGHEVIHCPFCHGYEVRDRTIVQIVTHPMGLHPTALFRQLTPDLTVVIHDHVEVDTSRLDGLKAAGVKVVQGHVRRVRSEGEGLSVELSDGDLLDADAIAIGPRFRVRTDPFVSLGLQTTPHPTGLGDVVEVDETGATAVPGLYAAGNVTDPSQQVLQAAAHGSRVGAMISFSLAEEDLRRAARPSADEADWDNRYSGAQLWSGNPNGSLVAEAAALAPGRALDVGAGEGGDAIWLAERGWSVTASDISGRALARIAAEADRRGADVTCRHTDANARDPFEAGAFDLVSVHYASIPRTPDNRAVHNILDAVVPGGTLLVVSHDLEPMRSPTHGHDQPWDPDAYVRVEDFAAVLADAPAWEIEINEKRPRPAGAASAAHHVDDLILRARRVAG